MRPLAELIKAFEAGEPLSNFTIEEKAALHKAVLGQGPVLGAGAPGEQIRRAEVPLQWQEKPRSGKDIATDVASTAASLAVPLVVPGAGLLPAATRIALAAAPELLGGAIKGESMEDAAIPAFGQAALQTVGEAAPLLPRAGIKAGLALRGVPKNVRRVAADAFETWSKAQPQLPMGMGPRAWRIGLGNTERTKKLIGGAQDTAVAARRASPVTISSNDLRGGTARLRARRELDPHTPQSDAATLYDLENQMVAENAAEFGPQINMEQLGDLTSAFQGKGRDVITRRATGAHIDPGERLPGKHAAETGDIARDILVRNVAGEEENRAMLRTLHQIQDANRTSGGDIGALNRLGVMGMGGGTGSGTARSAASVLGFETGPAAAVGSLLGMLMLNPQAISRGANAASRTAAALPTFARTTSGMIDSGELLKALNDELNKK